MTMVKMMSSCPVQSGGRLKEECNLCGRQLVRCQERLRAITLSLAIVVIIITSIITTIIIISTINNSMQINNQKAFLCFEPLLIYLIYFFSEQIIKNPSQL